MAAINIFRRKKGRRYPIKRDEYGITARARCFEMFKENVPFPEIAARVGIKVTTVRKYHQQWRQIDQDFERRYAFVKKMFDKTELMRAANIAAFANALGITPEEFESVLSQPHGLRRLLSGKLSFPTRIVRAHKLQIIIELAMVFAEHVIDRDGKFEDIYLALRSEMQRYQRRRETENADIIAANHRMALIRQILAVDMANEKKERVRRDTLSDAEREAIVKYGLDKERKKLETQYWLRVGILMAGGLTEKEAGDKIYREMVAKGDLKGANVLREIHEKSKKNVNIPSSTDKSKLSL